MEVFMKNKLYTIFILSAVTFLVSCKSASKLYQKGNYDEAVTVAAKKLQKDPNNKSLQSTITDAYRFAVNDHEKNIANYSSSNNDLKWEWIYNQYSSLQNLYDAIYRSPQVYQLVNPTDYSSYLATYAEKAGDARYERGLAWMEKNDKQSFKNAYSEFQAALRFKPGDIEVLDKMNEAYNDAVTNVVVLPINHYDFRFSSYNYDYNKVDERLIRNLKNNSGNQFVKFFSAAEARSLNIRIDNYAEMQFMNINIGGFYDIKKTREVSQKVVTKEIVYKPDSIVKVYSTVKAKITTTQRSMHSEGSILVTVRDAAGIRLWSDVLRSNDDWYTEFTTYTGDERALSDSDKQLVNRKEERPPSEDEIINCMTEEMNNSLPYKIRDYFNRF
jgi:tetratricopeptide (TPR) repeat protein